jgi:aldehyde dehydrogenase family 7 protein A1
VAVFGWNFCIALAAGNSTIWKPSPTTPLYVYSLVSKYGGANDRCAIAIAKLIEPILIRNGLPGAAAALVCGDIDVGKELVGSEDIPLGMCSPFSALDSKWKANGSEFHRE